MSSSSSSTSNASSSAPSHLLQRIYDTLKQIPRRQLEASVQDPGNCRFVRASLELCDQLTLEDLSLSRAALQRIEKEALCRCLHVCDDEDFELNVFIIPKGKSLPLHDHPGMTVISKVVAGSIDVRSFTRLAAPALLDLELEDARAAKRPRRDNERAPAARTGRVGVRAGLAGTKGPSDKAWFLTPSTDNIHELCAPSQTTVVFDVLMPPYRPPERDCHFWTLAAGAGGESAVLLLEPSADPPDDDGVYSLAYKGFVPTKTTTK